MGNNASCVDEGQYEYQSPTTGQWILLAFELLLALISPYLVKMFFLFIDLAVMKIDDNIRTNREDSKPITGAGVGSSGGSSNIDSKSNINNEEWKIISPIILPLREMFTRPLVWLLVGSFLFAAVYFAQYPCQIDYLQTLLSSIFLAIILVSSTFIGARLLDYLQILAELLFMRRFKHPNLNSNDNAADDDYYSAPSRSIPELNALTELLLYAKIIFCLIMIVVSAETLLQRLFQSSLGFNFQPNVIADAVVLAVVVYLREIISGATLLVDRSIRIGSRVVIDGVSGRIVSMGLRNVVLEQSDGSHVRISASTFISKPTIVYEDRFSRLAHIEIALSQSAIRGSEHIRQILCDVENMLVQYRNKIGLQLAEIADGGIDQPMLESTVRVNAVGVRLNPEQPIASVETSSNGFGNELFVGLGYQGEFFVSTFSVTETHYRFKSSLVDSPTLIVRLFIHPSQFPSFFQTKSSIVLLLMEYLESRNIINTVSI